MNRGARSWTEGDVHEVEGKLMYEAGRIPVPPTRGPDGRDEQSAGAVQRVIDKLKRILGKQ